MNGQQTITAAIGAGLVGGNYWIYQHKLVTAGVLNKKASTADEQAAHSTLFRVGLELLAVTVAVLLAGTSRSAGTAIAVVMTALAVIWIIRYERTK